jgi:hypothetical protein
MNAKPPDAAIPPPGFAESEESIPATGPPPPRFPSICGGTIVMILVLTAGVNE